MIIALRLLLQPNKHSTQSLRLNIPSVLSQASNANLVEASDHLHNVVKDKTECGLNPSGITS